MEWNLDVVLNVYYDLLEGSKEVETRSPDPSKPEKDYGKIVEGDSLIFHLVNDSFKRVSESEKLAFKAGNIRKYNSIEEMLETENIKSILPDVHSKEEALEIYYSFPGYKERIAKYGIIAIDLIKI